MHRSHADESRGFPVSGRGRKRDPASDSRSAKRRSGRGAPRSGPSGSGRGAPRLSLWRLGASGLVSLGTGRRDRRRCRHRLHRCGRRCRLCHGAGTRSPTPDTSALPSRSGQSGAPVRGDTNSIIAAGDVARPGATGVTAATVCSGACTTDLHRRTRTGRSDSLTCDGCADYIRYVRPGAWAVFQQCYTSARSEP